MCAMTHTTHGPERERSEKVMIEAPQNISLLAKPDHHGFGQLATDRIPT